MTDVEQQNWQSLGVVYNELRFRGQTDANALAMKIWVDAVDIPQMKEAQDLIAEDKQLEQWLRSTLQAIGTGDDDVGVRMQGYDAQWKAMQEARQSA